MGWEYRARGGPYYVRHTIRHGQTTREYLGRGPSAEQAAREDAEARARRDQERTAWQQLESLDAQVGTLDRSKRSRGAIYITRTLRAVTFLEGAGYG
jgi:hypothetical protein